MGAYFCGSLVLIKVSTQESDSWGGSRSPDSTANHSWAIMLVFSEVVGWDACLRMCLGELLSRPRRGWMIKREIRDSWLNWRLHLGTKNLNKSLGPWATYFPWKVCVFFQQNFVEGYVTEEWTGWVCGTYLMASCTRKLKTCRRFKTNSC